MTALRPPFLFATTPIGPPEKNRGVNPGSIIIELPVRSRIAMENTVPNVQNRNPMVAAFGENGSSAATSIAGIAFGTIFC